MASLLSAPSNRRLSTRLLHRHLAVFVATTLLMLAPWVFWSWWIGGLSGDLVRIGHWTERAYARRLPQAVVKIESNQLASQPGRRPDVVVLGDSFSMGNVWQSVLMQQSGLLSQSWGFGGHGCIPEFLDQIPESAQHVIIQTIERHLLDRFEKPAPCLAPGLAPFEGPSGTTDHLHPRGSYSTDWRYLLNSLKNHLREQSAPQDRLASGDTRSVFLQRGDLFSHRKPQRLLYYLGDDFKEGWTEERVQRAAQQAAHWQAQLQALRPSRPLRLTLLVVPDKSSVYRPVAQPPLPRHGQPEFAHAFQAAGVTVVWPLAAFQSAALSPAPLVDLYLPNDTHLSPQGFALLGQVMATQLSAPTAFKPAHKP